MRGVVVKGGVCESGLCVGGLFLFVWGCVVYGVFCCFWGVAWLVSY